MEKSSKDSATAMAEFYALIDTMPMRQRERLEKAMRGEISGRICE